MTEVDTAFPAAWTATLLSGPPLIAPARHIVLPQAVPGEEDALARGALWVDIRPSDAAGFLLQCALGFAGRNVLSGIWPTPEREVLLAVAGGYAYRVDTTAPARSTLLPLRPAVRCLPVQDPASLVLIGFHAVHVLQAGGDWTSPRLSWEGVDVSGVAGGVLHGTGWHMRTDRELPFELDLRTRELSGGGFTP